MKRMTMKTNEMNNRETLKEVMTEVDTTAADEQAAEKAYIEQVAHLDEQAAAEQAEIARRKADVDAAAKVDVSNRQVSAEQAAKVMETLANRTPQIVLARDDTHKAKAAPVFDALSNFGASLDLSAVRAKFAGYGDIIADALTEFVGVSAVENVALPVCRVRALSRIMNDESALKVIANAKTPDGKTTYGKTKSPVARFLMDNLSLSKQQVNAYMRVANVCVDKTANHVKPEFRGFTFTQLDILSASRNPLDNATKVDMALSTKDFKEAVARLDTEAATMAANNQTSGQPDEQKATETSGQPDEQKATETSGQPDEQKATETSGQPDGQKAAEQKAAEQKAVDNLLSFVVGNVPANNAASFTPQVKPGTDKPIVIRAANLTAAVSLFCQTEHENRVLFRLPKAAEKAIVDALPAAFNGYSVKAIVGDVVGYFGRATLYALATVVTVGTTENDETSKQAAKRIETGRVVLANWLTGAAELQGIPNAVDTVNAMEVFKKAYDMVRNVPRMSAQVALADLYKSGDFQTDPNKDVDGNGNSDADIANQQSAEYSANGMH